MVEQLSDNITSFLIRENIIEKDEFELYRYGMKQLVTNFFMAIVIGIIATFFHQWKATIFFFIGFMPLRLVAGGYHAETPRRCHVLSLAVYAGNLILIQVIYPFVNFQICLSISVFIIFCVFRFAPVDHKNRILVDEEFIRARKRSRLFACCLITSMVTGILIYEYLSVLIVGTMMGALTASISLIIGNLKRKGERNEEIELVN